MKEYTLIRSKRRTICICFDKQAQVVVRAPEQMPQREIDAFVLRHQKWVEKHQKQVRERREKELALTPAQLSGLKEQAERMILPLVEKYAARMGLRPTGVRITGARQRFGSCSAKGNLCFSCFLAQYPIEAVEYVVVHELAHLVYRHHQPTFHALVQQYLPDAQQRRKLLQKMR